MFQKSDHGLATEVIIVQKCENIMFRSRYGQVVLKGKFDRAGSSRLQNFHCTQLCSLISEYVMIVN